MEALMGGSWSQFPQVVNQFDLARMRTATKLAVEMSESIMDMTPTELAEVVFRFYRRGLTDPQRVAEVAVFLASSRLFRMRVETTIQQQHHELISDYV